MRNTPLFLALTLAVIVLITSACAPSTSILVTPQPTPQILTAQPTPNPPISTEKPSTLLPGNYDEKFTFESTERTYRMVVPQKYNGTPIPLVLFLHGRGGDGKNFEGYCGMTRKAEAAGFVVVYPDALGAPTAWNAGFNRGRIDSVNDVGYIKALIKLIRQRLVIDPQRIYIGGFSSGGIMSYRLATELSDQVAAFGIMAGTIGAVLPDGKINQIPNPKSPTSILHIHGKKDDIVPYDGPQSKIAPSEYFSAPQSVRFWVEKNGCNPTPKVETSFAGKLIQETYTGCTGGVDVSFYTLPEGNHDWPTLTREDKSTITASDLMWDYFARHTLQSPAP